MPDNLIQNTELIWKMFVFLAGLVLSSFAVLWGLIKTGSRLIFGNQILRIGKNEARIDKFGILVSKLECNLNNEIDAYKKHRLEGEKDLANFRDRCNDRFDKVAHQLEKQNIHIVKIDMLLENLIDSNKEAKEHRIRAHEDNKKLQERIIELLAKQLDKK